MTFNGSFSRSAKKKIFFFLKNKERAGYFAQLICAKFLKHPLILQIDLFWEMIELIVFIAHSPPTTTKK